MLCTYRYYDPTRGRWLTRDPIGYGGGLNLYGYCGADPVGGVDPLGLQATELIPEAPEVLLRELAEETTENVSRRTSQNVAGRAARSVGTRAATSTGASLGWAGTFCRVTGWGMVAASIVQGYALYEDIRGARVAAWAAEPAPGYYERRQRRKQQPDEHSYIRVVGSSAEWAAVRQAGGLVPSTDPRLGAGNTRIADPSWYPYLRDLHPDAPGMVIVTFSQSVVEMGPDVYRRGDAPLAFVVRAAAANRRAVRLELRDLSPIY